MLYPAAPPIQSAMQAVIIVRNMYDLFFMNMLNFYANAASTSEVSW